METNPMTTNLTIHNAEVKTAVIQVRTLTVSDREFTLAMFRQLREKKLIDDDGAILGSPLGYVNYHPDKCEPGEPPDHLHVVWQQRGDLLRAQVTLRVEPHAVTSPAAAEFIQALYCMNGHELGPGNHGHELTLYGDHYHYWPASGEVLVRRCKHPYCTAQFVSWKHPHQKPVPCLVDANLDDLWEPLHAEVQAEIDRRARVAAAIATIEDLPQLFLAA